MLRLLYLLQHAKPMAVAVAQWVSAHSPSVPSPVRSAVLWCWDAARFEAQVAVGIGLTLLAYVSLTGFWLIIAFGLDVGIIAKIAYVLFLTVIVNTGLAVPFFAAIAWPKLWVREWVITRHGIEENFVHPRTRAECNPAHLWRYGSQVLIVRQEDGSPMPSSRTLRLFSDTDIHNSVAKDWLAEYAAPEQKRPWQQPVNMMLLFGIIMAALFWAVALASE